MTFAVEAMDKVEVVLDFMEEVDGKHKTIMIRKILKKIKVISQDVQVNTISLLNMSLIIIHQMVGIIN